MKKSLLYVTRIAYGFIAVFFVTLIAMEFLPIQMPIGRFLKVASAPIPSERHQ